MAVANTETMNVVDVKKQNLFNMIIISYGTKNTTQKSN